MENSNMNLIILYDLDEFAAYRSGKQATIATYLRATQDPEKRLKKVEVYAKNIGRRLTMARIIPCFPDRREAVNRFIASRFQDKREIRTDRNGAKYPTKIYNLDAKDLTYLMNLPDGFNAEEMMK